MNKKKLENFIMGKGFYIVLGACVLVIAISAVSLIRAGVFSPEADAPEIVTGNINAGNDTPSEPEVPTSSDGEKDDPVSVFNEADSEPVSSPDDVQDTPPAQTAADVFAAPVSGEVACGYSSDELIYSKTMADWRVHTGVDFAADLGEPVSAAGDGTVKKIYSDDLFGTTVIVDHGNGVCSIYSNLAATPAVSEGDTVSLGDTIGAVGDTAIGETGEVSHLHFAMEKDGARCDPFDYIK